MMRVEFCRDLMAIMTNLHMWHECSLPCRRSTRSQFTHETHEISRIAYVHSNIFVIWENKLIKNFNAHDRYESEMDVTTDETIKHIWSIYVYNQWFRWHLFNNVLTTPFAKFWRTLTKFLSAEQINLFAVNEFRTFCFLLR